MNLQADSSFRIQPEDVGKLKVRSAAGDMIPLATLLTVEDSVGPAIVNRYNMFTAAEINGNPGPGTSSGQATALMEEIAKQELPPGMGYQWTELTLQQILAGNTAPFVFALGEPLRLPRPLRAVRELVAAARDHPDRADVPPERHRRHLARRHGQQHLHPDRLRRPDRPRGQERDPDRRVREGARGPGRRSSDGSARRRAASGSGRSS